MSTHEVYKTQGEKEKINIARIVTVHDYCSVFTSIRFNLFSSIDVMYP